MLMATVEGLSLTPGTTHAEEKAEVTLAGAIEELARLRFSIILTARWEAAETDDAERRGELQVELAELRRTYFNRIDEIAMGFGVQQAMDAREEIERNVVVPRNLKSLERDSENGFRS
jgi:hypothetical protein